MLQPVKPTDIHDKPQAGVGRMVAGGNWPRCCSIISLATVNRTGPSARSTAGRAIYPNLHHLPGMHPGMPQSGAAAGIAGRRVGFDRHTVPGHRGREPVRLTRAARSYARRFARWVPSSPFRFPDENWVWPRWTAGLPGLGPGSEMPGVRGSLPVGCREILQRTNHCGSAEMHGCGRCESGCPVAGSAIRVYPL